MKALRTPLFAFVLGLALLAVILVAVTRRGAGPEPSYAIDPAVVARAVGLDIALEGDSVSLARERGGLWVVTPYGVPADSARLAAVLDGLARLTTVDIAARAPDTARLAAFGLAPANAKRVTLRLEDGAARSVLIGHTSDIDFASSYWKMPDRPEVYRTPGRIALDAAPRAEAWHQGEGGTYGAPELPEVVEMMPSPAEDGAGDSGARAPAP